jgi:hypothetical protein
VVVVVLVVVVVVATVVVGVVLVVVVVVEAAVVVVVAVVVVAAVVVVVAIVVAAGSLSPLQPAHTTARSASAGASATARCKGFLDVAEFRGFMVLSPPGSLEKLVRKFCHRPDSLNT